MCGRKNGVGKGRKDGNNDINIGGLVSLRAIESGFKLLQVFFKRRPDQTAASAAAFQCTLMAPHSCVISDGHKGFDLAFITKLCMRLWNNHKQKRFVDVLTGISNNAVEGVFSSFKALMKKLFRHRIIDGADVDRKTSICEYVINSGESPPASRAEMLRILLLTGFMPGHVEKVRARTAELVEEDDARCEAFIAANAEQIAASRTLNKGGIVERERVTGVSDRKKTDRNTTTGRKTARAVLPAAATASAPAAAAFFFLTLPPSDPRRSVDPSTNLCS